jgi:hypothetical protein
MPGYVMRPPSFPLNIIAPTTQDIAIVMCGGGEPFEEYENIARMCERSGKVASIFAGNDMIEKFPGDVAHAVTLHPDKLKTWLSRRKSAGFSDVQKVWAHRNYEGSVTNWTRDWSGSTGLFCIKIARECGFVHIVTCGVHMTTEANHFVRKQPWLSAHGFRRGWMIRLPEIRPYVRSMGGWTQEELGAPTEEWLNTEIEDQHRYNRVGGIRA